MAKWRPLLLTVGLACVTFVSAAASYAMSTALPIAAADLGSKNAYGWGMAMFFSGSTLGVCLAAFFSGRARPAVIQAGGLATFALGLTLAAASTTGVVLVLARTIQGVGSGVEIVSVYVLIARCYGPSQRPRMVALINTTLVLPGMVGPAAAGWAATTFGWRWVFVALAGGVVVAAMLTIVPTRRLQAEGPSGRGWRSLGGGLAAIAGLTLLQFAGLAPWQVSIGLLPPALLLVVLAVRMFMPAGTMTLRPGTPAFTGMRALLAASYFGGQIWIPAMLLELHGMSAVHAGLTLIGAPLGWGLGAAWQGRIGVGEEAMAQRRRHVAIGASCSGVGMLAMLASAAVAFPLAVLIVLWTVAALGGGLAAASVTVLLLDSVKAQSAGTLGSSLQLAETLASGTAIALGTVVYQLKPFTDDRTGAFIVIFGGAAALSALAARSTTRLVLAPTLEPSPVRASVGP